MNLSDVIAAYNVDRRAKGVAPKTLRNEQQVLSLLLADVGNLNTRNMRPQHIDTFWVKRTTWGPGTMNRARYSLSTFFKWCQNRGHVDRGMDLLAGHKALKVPPRDRVIIPQSEWSTFIEGRKDPRARAVAAIGLYQFLRLSEIQALRWQDLNFDLKTAEVYRPKTLTLDTLPICEELEAELRRWKLTYAARVGQPVQGGWFVIPAITAARRRGVPGVKGFSVTQESEYFPLKRSHLGHVMATMLTEAGYYRPMEGGHTLRRSGATALYNQLTSVGHDRAIRVCQAMLGHSSVVTTEVYLRLDLDRKVRNDLLAGKPMFPDVVEGEVVSLRLGREEHGEENVRDLRM